MHGKYNPEHCLYLKKKNTKTTEILASLWSLYIEVKAQEGLSCHGGPQWDPGEFASTSSQETKKAHEILGRLLPQRVVSPCSPSPKVQVLHGIPFKSLVNPVLAWIFCYGKGVLLPHSLSTYRDSCAGSDQKPPTSAQGRFLGKSLRTGKVIAWDTPMSLWLQGFLSQRWCFWIWPSMEPYSTELSSFLKTGEL